MRILLVLCLLFCTFTFAQDSISNPDVPPATSSQAELTSQSILSEGPSNLLDSPSAVKALTCTQRDGKPCPEWVHKLVGQYPAHDITEKWNRQPDHFFALGNGRRALHPDKKSWMIFTLAHAGLWASMATSVRNQRASLEDASSAYPAVAALTGLDFVFFKTINPAMSVGPPVYGMVHYIRAAAK